VAGFQTPGFTGQRMGDMQAAGMQKQAPGPGLHIRRRIQRVAQDGMTQFAQMHAQLVRTSGNRFEVDARARSGFVDCQHAPAGEAGFAKPVVDRPPRPVRPVDRDGQINRAPAPRRRLQPAGDHGDIALRHLACRKGPVQRALCRQPARHHHQARGGHIKPMHDQRIGIAGLHPRAQAILLVGTAPRHRQQAAGLVEHEHGIVSVEDLDGGCSRQESCREI